MVRWRDGIRGLVVGLALALPAAAQRTNLGRDGLWSPPFAFPSASYPAVAIHLSVLPDGRLLGWARHKLDGVHQMEHHDTEGMFLWDPADGACLPLPDSLSTDLFCAGHSFLPDGRLFIAGGHVVDGAGTDTAGLFDAVSDSQHLSAGRYEPVERMNAGRWYPSALTLGTGEVLIAGGTIVPGVNNDLSQVYHPARGWRNLDHARRWLPYYPRLFQLSDGTVFVGGSTALTFRLNPVGSGEWFWDEIFPSTLPYYRWDYSDTAVMYAPDRVLRVGGIHDGGVVAHAESIDLALPKPAWQAVAPMRYARQQHNSVLLPDGKVLVVGGGSGDHTDPGKAVKIPELWDPSTRAWRTVAPMTRPRLYHSTALLLPDARVLSAGGGLPAYQVGWFFEDAEIYSPYYLFTADGRPAPRPQLTQVQGDPVYGGRLELTTPQAAEIDQAALISLPSVTHSFSFNQRRLVLPLVERSGSQVSVALPDNPNAAPPGPYMLFLLRKGVPSTAKVLRLHTPALGELWRVDAAGLAHKTGERSGTGAWRAEPGRHSPGFLSVGTYRAGSLVGNADAFFRITLERGRLVEPDLPQLFLEAADTDDGGKVIGRRTVYADEWSQDTEDLRLPIAVTGARKTHRIQLRVRWNGYAPVIHHTLRVVSGY